MIGYVYEDFVQPAQGAFVSIHLESRSDLIIGLGFIQIGTAGVYNIVETRLHPNGRYNVDAIRLNFGIPCETETGGLIRRGEVVRSLKLKQVRSIAVEHQSRPHGPLPDYQGTIDRWSSSLATGWGDSREAYVFRHKPSLHPPSFGFGFTHSFSMPKVPKGCVGCSNLHGKAYTGEHGRNMLICGMHPSGYEGEGQCPDRQ